MPAFLHAGFLIFALGLIILPVAFVYSDHLYLTLERIIPNDHNIELNELKNRDRTRHARILQSSIGVVDFSVQGSADPHTFGLYFTRVKLGSPPKEFNVQIDTGSDMLWVNCNSCSGCPKSSGLGIELQFFDPGSSSSASPISCTDSVCSSVVHTVEAVCLENSHCGYQFQYGDGSGAAGFYLSDMLGFDTVTGNSLMSNSSAPVVFGCSNHLSGDFTDTDNAVDGIIGFGQHDMSIIQQLSSRGITPRVFSHCLDGTGRGGGVLVLGEVVAEGIVYSPLVPSKSLYNLDLQSIAINGQLVPIDPAVFSNGQGTIVDSGTTLAHLPEEAFDPFVNALVAVVQQSVKPFIDKKGNQCFIAQTSVSEAFPPVMLNFAGGATMVLKPENYLVQTSGHQGEWCVGFQKGDLQGQRVTILGDLVLKDKIIIYDLARQRIGWVNYDCSQPVNVTLGSGNEKIREDALYQLIIPIAATAISL
ncbi:aspartic proteinase-like protein 2 isoform X3 [Papaver somniferum]|uniref:aspartic proteinase-like protein 2 isoform X3 n=1 Tax=Papaver somniferum TaxID=3469 RepID=UPI000E704F7C|nr:aspartic proteinase-like protein 2 isoform X3 [Papaver somniferum]